MKNKAKPVRWLCHGLWPSVLFAVLSGFILSAVVFADDFDDYGNYEIHNIVLPEVMGGWFDAIDYFPDNEMEDTIGVYETRGRLLVVNHRTVYLQKNYGAGADQGTWNVGDPDAGGLPGGHDNFIPVATVSIVNEYPPGMGSMDPSFVKISPDGTKVALGMGWGQPLLVFPISVLDPDNPPLLNGEDGLTPIPGVEEWLSNTVQYYDAEWVDDDRLAMNVDWGWDPEHQTGVGSQVDLLDTSSSSNAPVTIINQIEGASADVTIDKDGNIITGNGYDYPPGPDVYTGQIKIFSKAEWESAYGGGTPLDYGATGGIVADNVLSAAQLGVDRENNLHVGGGSWLGGEGDELGYAALIEQSVLARVLAGGVAPVDEDNSNEYKELAPDPMGDDSATSPVNYSQWGEGLSVCWNPSQAYGGLYPGSDLWCTGVKPILTTYYAANPPDQDGDGVPDGSDNAWLTENAGQEDTDGDGWANAADADFDNTNVVDVSDYNYFKGKWDTDDAVADMDSSGTVDPNDFVYFKGRWNDAAPYY